MIELVAQNQNLAEPKSKQQAIAHYLIGTGHPDSYDAVVAAENLRGSYLYKDLDMTKTTPQAVHQLRTELRNILKRPLTTVKLIEWYTTDGKLTRKFRRKGQGTKPRRGEKMGGKTLNRVFAEAMIQLDDPEQVDTLRVLAIARAQNQEDARINRDCYQKVRSVMRKTLGVPLTKEKLQEYLDGKVSAYTHRKKRSVERNGLPTPRQTSVSDTQVVQQLFDNVGEDAFQLMLKTKEFVRSVGGFEEARLLINRWEELSK